MGLFSSKKKTYVSAITERMLEDKDFKYSSQYAMQYYIFTKDSMDLNSPVNLSNTLLEYTSHNLPNKYNKLYRLASHENRYVFGLPKDALLSKPVEQMNTVIKTYLDGIEANPVTILYNYIGDRNYEHTAWTKLVGLYGYSGLNNELKVLSDELGFVCYLSDGFITYTQATYDDWLIAETCTSQKVLPFNYGECFDRVQSDIRDKTPSVIGDTDKFTFTYKYKTADDVIHEETKEIDLSWINPVVSNTADNTEEPDLVQTGYKVDTEYKFFTYEFLSGKIVDIDGNLKIDDGLGEYYPRIYLRTDNVDMLDSKDDIKKKHTKKALKILGLELADITKQINKGIGNELNKVRNIYLDMSICINKVKDDTVQAEYLYRYFNKLYALASKSSAGLIQTIQDNQSSLTIKYSDISKSIQTGVATNNSNKAMAVGEYCIMYTTGHKILYQVSSNSYIEIVVNGLVSQVRVKNKTATNNNTDENLSLPLDKSIIKDLKPKERELLFNKCFCVEIQTHQVVKQKWYQSAIFKILLTVISIAISVFSGGTGVPISAMIQSAIVGLITSTAIGFVINLVIKVAIKLGISPEILAIMVLIATVVSLGKGINANTFKVTNLMKALNKSFGIYNKALQAKLQNISKEMQDFQKESADKTKALKAKQDMLLTGVIPLGLELLSRPLTQSMYINLGETPEQFYTRTGLKDLSQIVLNYATNYVQLNLQLPKQVVQRDTEDIESILLIT